MRCSFLFISHPAPIVTQLTSLYNMGLFVDDYVTGGRLHVRACLLWNVGDLRGLPHLLKVFVRSSLKDRALAPVFTIVWLHICRRQCVDLV
jgi:hypothetical protein